MTFLKGKLSAKDLEINELKRELEKSNEIKEQYRVYYDKLKNEILRLKKENETIRESAQKQNNAEIEQLKIKLSTLTMMENKENLQSFKNEFHDFRSHLQGDHALQTSAKNPL